MAEWFKDWFDTKEYLNVYRHRNNDDARKLVDLILNNIEIYREDKVLDMACGSGRHSILFAEKGFRVTAVDLSRNLLNVAKEAARKENLNIDFIRSDLREFSICSDFRLVNNLFTSFGYFEDDCDNFRIFEVAYNHLLEKGYFVLDYFNSRYIEKNLVKESVEDFGNEKIIQRRSIQGTRVNKQIIIKFNGSQKNYHESVRMYSKGELFSVLESTGFKIVKYFGDSRGNSFDLETSPRIIIIARK